MTGTKIIKSSENTICGKSLNNMRSGTLNISSALNALSKNRKLFHSEADFQFALAWEIQKLYPAASVRLEYSPAKIHPTIHIDILVIMGNDWYPIELKYKSLNCLKINNGEEYNLKSHVAQDIGRYDYLKDVQGIEMLGRLLPRFKKGYSIFLTNDLSYWSDNMKETAVCYSFKLSEKEIKKGILSWAGHTGQGTMKGREMPIVLEREYLIHWQEYSRLDDTKSGCFRYIILDFEA